MRPAAPAQPELPTRHSDNFPPASPPSLADAADNLPQVKGYLVERPASAVLADWPVTSPGQSRVSSGETTAAPSLRSRDKTIELVPGVHVSKSYWVSEIQKQQADHPGLDLFELLLKICKARGFYLGTEYPYMDLTYESDEARLTFLRKVASLDPKYFAKNAEHLRMLPFEERRELAIACGNEAANHSDDFGMDQAEELLILKALASNADTAKGVAEAKERLQSFDSQDRLELAWACMKAAPIDTGDCIMNFDIPDKVERYRLAREYLSSADFPDLGNLGNLARFELQESHLYDILAPLARGSATASDVARAMRKLDIASAEKRTALAWDCMRAAPDNTPDFIEYFKIPDEGERCRLALTYFRRSESPDPDDLRKFDLNSPESLKIAIHAASKVMQKGAHFKSLDSYISDAVKDAKLQADLKIRLCIQAELAGICKSEANSCLIELKSQPRRDLSKGACFFLDSILDQKERWKISDQGRKLSTDASPGAQEQAGEWAVAQASAALLRKSLLNGQPSVAHTMQLVEDIPTSNDQSFSEVWPKLRWIRNAWFELHSHDKVEGSAAGFIPALARLIHQPDESYRWTLTSFLTALTPDQLAALPKTAPGKTSDKQMPGVSTVPLAALAALPLGVPGLVTAILALPSKALKNGHNEKRLAEALLTLGSGMYDPELIRKLLRRVFSAEAPARPLLAPGPSANLSKRNTRDTQITSISPSGDAAAKSSTRSAPPEKGFDLLMRQLAKCQFLVASDEEMAHQVATGSANLDAAVNRWVLTTLESGNATTSVVASTSESQKWAGLESTFFKYREPMTLPTYLHSIRYQQVAFEALSRFVTAVLEEQYPKVRYEHDALLSALPAKIRQGWQENVVQNSATAGKTLHFTDSHQSLMRMGSDVAGSCQRVDGDPDLNRGLIGTVMDGKHKLIALCDSSGRIVARSVIRLMSTTAFDDTVKPAPCAMVERIYPPNASEPNKKQLLEFARSQANRMNLRLLASSDVNLNLPGITSTPCELTLYSGRLAYPVYCDAREGMVEQFITIAPDNNKPMRWIT